MAGKNREIGSGLVGLTGFGGSGGVELGEIWI